MKPSRCPNRGPWPFVGPDSLSVRGMLVTPDGRLCAAPCPATIGPMARRESTRERRGNSLHIARRHDLIHRIEPNRLLVVLPNWVGDLVLATPALRAFRQRFSTSHIAFLVRPHLADILSGGDWMDEVIRWPSRRHQARSQQRRGFLGLAARLRDKRFDCAVLLTNSFKSALLARLAAIPRRVGYDRDGRGLLLTDRLLPERANGKYVPIPMTRYYNAVARYMGSRECPPELELFTTPKDEAGADQALASAGVEPDRPIVVLNPAASFGPAKCWLPDRFAQVADGLAERHNAAVFISCGPREISAARQVAGSMKHRGIVLDQPVMPLGPMKALIRRASLLVTNDTGPRHFAKAFGTPVVTVFGPTDPRWTELDFAAERKHQVKVHCGPCMKRTCPLDHRCMTRIPSEAVLASAEELLAERPTTIALASPE